MRPGRETFLRYAKALLTGERASGSVAQPIGLRYEIVPDVDPTVHLAPFHGRVLYDGRPLPGALVVALLKGEPSERLTTRSDDQGTFAFALPQAGVWLVKSVHMTRAAWYSHADWESFWASLTFEVPGGKGSH
jgi:uncharacterized GH25 family protein